MNGHIFSRVLRDSIPRYVGSLVGWLVSQSVGWLVLFLLFGGLSFLSIRLLSICPGDVLQHCSCQPARDWGSRVSGLVSFYPALLNGAHPSLASVITRYAVVRNENGFVKSEMETVKRR